MKQRDLHKEVRVVYRACRKLYGIEKVQDECLRVFKVVFPLLHKARTTDEYGFTDEAQKRIEKIFDSWNAVPGSQLDQLLYAVTYGFDIEQTKEQFIEFCEDILPVVMKIRKLTNRECYRLQGVSEKDIDTLLSCGISRSSHYKLAGNSITSGGNYCNKEGMWDGPLFNLFRKLFVDIEPDMVKGKPLQLELF